MTEIGIVGLILIIANVILSYKGFNDSHFFNRLKFNASQVLINKDYKRLLTSGFLHTNWTHLIFNMLSLYAFSGLLEYQIKEFPFLLIYFVSLVGGNLLALFIHRNHGEYSAVGASGAVCGVIFASIALFPGIGISFIFLPFSIPSWLYGLLYICYSIYGIKSKRDNIGHEAHLGGALAGMLIAVMLRPNSLIENYLPILASSLPAIVFIYLIVTKPHILLIDNYFSNPSKSYYNIDHRYNERKVNRQKELDDLLDKISARGIDSLSAKEKKKLEEFSN